MTPGTPGPSRRAAPEPTGTLTHEQYLATRRYDAIDGLRAPLLLLVIMWHVSPRLCGPLGGWQALTVFMCITGFLITTLALREETRRGGLNLRAFYVRRAARIVAPYLAVLSVYVVAMLGFGLGTERAAFRTALPYYLTFMNELAPHAPFFHSWSLGVQEKFYLLWPLVGFGWWAGSARRRVVGLVALSALAVLPLLLAGVSYGIPYVPIFGGCLLAVLLRHPRGYALLRPLATRWGIAAALVLLALAHFSLEGLVGVNGSQAAYTVPACLALVGVVAGPARWRRPLTARPLVWVGRRSYEAYLIHVLVLGAVLRVLPGRQDAALARLVLVLTVAGTLTAAGVLYRWVEQPALRAGKSWSDGLLAGRTARELLRRRLPAVPVPAVVPPPSLPPSPRAPSGGG